MGYQIHFTDVAKLIIASTAKIWFRCDVCYHAFRGRLHNVTRDVNPGWCPYCAQKKLCGDINCEACFEHSFASYDSQKVQAFRNAGNLVEPHTVMKHSAKYFKFKCFVCAHFFRARLCTVSDISNPVWCSYCTGKKVCGLEDCKKCAKQCEDGLCEKRATRLTQVTRKWYCQEHFDYCIRSDPNETPLIRRAKITLEIYMLAELVRIAMLPDGNYSLWANHTSWDCAIYPGLSYKPDIVIFLLIRMEIYWICV